jgi:deazaflavin-dependent oxidoreductase (nitroreductase family)
MTNSSIPAMARGHLVNPIVRAVLRSPIHRLFSGSLLLLEYTGRRTRNRHAIPVGYVPSSVDGDLIVVAGQHATKTWWRNFNGLPQQVTLQLRGQPARASARLLQRGTEEYLDAVRAYSTRLPRARMESDAPVLLVTPVA